MRYKYLKAGELRKPGDEYNHSLYGWMKAVIVCGPVPENMSLDYRRPIKPKKKATK